MNKSAIGFQKCLLYFRKFTNMNTELKKLKGCSIRTCKGQYTLKQYLRPQNCEFDQIYFKTNDPDIIIKIYDLEHPVSTQRYNNQIHYYKLPTIPMLHAEVHAEQLKIKKRDHGVIILMGIGKEPSLNEMFSSLTQRDLCKLTKTMLKTLVALRESNLLFCNFRPENIYKVGNKFVLINPQYVRTKTSREQMDDFLLQTVEKDWQYWPPQVLDTYSKEVLDYAVDVFAVGCILFQSLNRGVYPFESKLTAQSNFFVKVEDRGILGHLTNACLDNADHRRVIKLKQLIKSLSSELKESPTKQKSAIKLQVPQNHQGVSLSSDKTAKKTGGNGFLDNLSTAFTKMMNDTEGWFLNYVQDNNRTPNDKYLDQILVKLYRSEDKADKLSTIIQKHLKNNQCKLFSVQKTLLLIGQVLRKGPVSISGSFTQCLQLVDSIFKSEQNIGPFCQLLLHKLKVQERVRKCLTGNYYLQEISSFRQLTIAELSQMAVYLQKLVTFIQKKVNQKAESELIRYTINFVCDDIFDLVSMLILSVICIRKDNEIQLRNDNLKELGPLQRMINSSLKKTSDLSNNIEAHAIYSLERQYISYQEEISLSSNPYYSTLEHFYRSSRNYKGLSIPQNYSQIYCQNKEIKKSAIVSTSYHEKIEVPNKGYFGGEEVQSDEEAQISKPTIPAQSAIATTPLSVFDEFQIIAKDSPKKPTVKHEIKKGFHQPTKSAHIASKVETRTKDDQKSSKGSKHSKNKNETSKAQSSMISFQQFSNIHLVERVSPEKKANDFGVFNDFKPKEKKYQNKPPMPNTKALKQRKGWEKQPSAPNVMNFEEFSKIAANQKEKKEKIHKKKEEQENSLNLLGFEELNKVKSSDGTPSLLNLDIQDNPFFQNNSLLLPIPPLKENPLVENILKGLKLKQLKELLKKNEKFIIDFQNLKLNKVIGSGSAGEVFLGEYKGEAVAIKKVKAKENPNALKQFERELVTYIKIQKNPHLVSLVGLSESNGDFYLLTEFCTSGSLFDLLHKRRNQIVLNWKQRLSFAVQIAEGMKFLHSMKPVIIHRDLKSLNVFVTREQDRFKMKVADFGLSRSPEAQMMTTQLGTIHWMAPELLEGKQYSLKVDVYSYGILLWEILSRRTPYSNLQNPMAILKYVAMDRKRPDLSSIPPECPNQLVNVMEKCWAHEAQHRPNFSQILEELRRIKV